MLSCRRGKGEDYESDSPHKPPVQTVVYRDDTAGRPRAQETVEPVWGPLPVRCIPNFVMRFNRCFFDFLQVALGDGEGKSVL